jgi:hypothetical protein
MRGGWRERQETLNRKTETSLNEGGGKQSKEIIKKVLK